MGCTWAVVGEGIGDVEAMIVSADYDLLAGEKDAISWVFMCLSSFSLLLCSARRCASTGGRRQACGVPKLQMHGYADCISNVAFLAKD